MSDQSDPYDPDQDPDAATTQDERMRAAFRADDPEPVHDPDLIRDTDADDLDFQVEDEPPSFSPWRPFCALAALIVLPFVLTRDLGGDLLDTLSLSIDGLEPVIGQWGVEFAARLIGNTMRLAFLLGIVTAVLYGLLQLLGVGADRAWVEAGPGTRRTGLIRAVHALSGRRCGSDRSGFLSASADWGSDTLLSPLRLGVTLFPMLGFLGTIVGLSGAIADLPEAVRDKDRLDPVLRNLYVAFDTTFMGLLGAILCLVLARLTESRIDALVRLRDLR